MAKLDAKVMKKEVEAEVIEKISCPDLENKFILVRVGDAARPATEDDIKEVTDKLENMFEQNGINCLTFVTHHAVSVEIIEKQEI